MTIYQETTDALSRDPDIGRLYHALSAGDRSILWMLLDNDEGYGTTMDGSPNDRFWQRLSIYGWMAKAEGQPDLAPLPLLQYRVTDTGYRAIPVLLNELAPRVP